jgi:hypothetical protein
LRPPKPEPANSYETRTMEREHIITIYKGVVIRLPVRGEQRLLKERQFLAEMVGHEFAAHSSSLPESDPGHDFYELTDEQHSKYLDFRSKLNDEERRS